MEQKVWRPVNKVLVNKYLFITEVTKPDLMV